MRLRNMRTDNMPTGGTGVGGWARSATVVVTTALTLCAAGTAFAQAPAQDGALAARGSYLVNTLMTCHNCHTPRGPAGFIMDKALSGGSQVFDEPPFRVRGANLTPDKETGLGAWSDAELKHFLLTGIRPNGVPVAPIMPTAFYKVLTPRDLDAIVAYLRTLPPVVNQVAAPVYRVALPPDVVPGVTSPMSEADMADKVKRGFYLASLAHCMECHTPMGDHGKNFESSWGQGGMRFTGGFGESVSANITSHQTKGIGGWTDDEIKRAITQGVSRDGHRLKPPMGYAFYDKMTPEDLDAIVAWLRTVPPKG